MRIFAIFPKNTTSQSRFDRRVSLKSKKGAATLLQNHSERKYPGIIRQPGPPFPPQRQNRRHKPAVPQMRESPSLVEKNRSEGERFTPMICIQTNQNRSQKNKSEVSHLENQVKTPHLLKKNFYLPFCEKNIYGKALSFFRNSKSPQTKEIRKN